MSGVIWKPLQYKTETVVETFGAGVNSFATPFSIGEGELTDCLNICSDDLPVARTRNDRVPLSSNLVSTPYGIFRRTPSQIHVADGTAWKYWDIGTSNYSTLSSSITAVDAWFDEFAVGTNRWTIMMNSTQKLYASATDSTALAFTDTNLPFTNMFTVHKGRVYALSSNDVHFSGLNLSTDWTSSNAGQLNITNARGTGSAIRTYNDHVIIWSAQSMHELFGTGPSNYELKDIANDIGCVNQKVPQEVKGKLYWLDYTGVYQYTGGIPRKVSDKVDKWIAGINSSFFNLCAAGFKDEKYFLAIPYKSTQNNMILVYDTYKDTWNIQDGNFNNFTNLSDTIYGTQTTASKIWNMESTVKTGSDNSTQIPWEFYTKAYNYGSPSGDKTISRMYVTAEGTSTSSLEINYTTNINSTTVKNLYNSSALSTEPQVIQINMPTSEAQNMDWFRLQYSGSGHAKIHNQQINTRIKKRS